MVYRIELDFDMPKGRLDDYKSVREQFKSVYGDNPKYYGPLIRKMIAVDHLESLVKFAKMNDYKIPEDFTFV